MENLSTSANLKENPLSIPKDTPKEPWQREVDGVFMAMQFIHLKARGVQEGGLTRDDIFCIHRMVMNDPFNPEKTGQLRNVKVKVGSRIEGTMNQGLPPDPHFLSEFYNEFASTLENMTEAISIDSSVEEIVELAGWAHHEFIMIHPFEDGNGRTARLLVDFIFRKARLPYIKDWGAAKHEYDRVIDDCFDQENSKPFKIFLSRKLLDRLVEIGKQFAPKLTDGQNFRDYVNGRIDETEVYIENLAKSNAS